MKKLLTSSIVGLLAITLYGQPVIDGVITPGEGWVLLSTSANQNGGGAGANLNEFYVYPDQTSFYAAVTTNNTASWDVAYGIGLDFDKILNSGYYGNVGTDTDGWERYIYFVNSSTTPYAVEYEFYWWWDGATGAVTSYNSPEWTGSGWNYPVLGTYAYTGDGSTGLQVLEFKVDWTDLGFSPGTYPLEFYTSTWVAGGSGSSAVDAIPFTPTVADGGGGEWTDTDDVLLPIGASKITEATSTKNPLTIAPGLNKLVLSSSHSVNVEINIYSANGSLVDTRMLNLTSGQHLVDFNNLKTGVYIVNTIANKSLQTTKLLVLH